MCAEMGMSSYMCAEMELPRYKCCKCCGEVWALKIAAIEYPTNAPERPKDGVARLAFEDTRYPPIWISLDYANHHIPCEGGYYVVHADGDASYSPANVFEAVHTLITK